MNRNHKFESNQKLYEIIRYYASGLISNAIGFSLFLAFLSLSIEPRYAVAISSAMVLPLAYSLNRTKVFKSKKSTVGMKIAFVIQYLFFASANLILMKLLESKISPVPSQILILIVLSLISFGFQKRSIFN